MQMKLSHILHPEVGKRNEHTREVWLRQTLERIPEGSRILDAGAGTQKYREFCQHLNYVSQDFGQYDGIGDTAGLQIKDFNYGKVDIISDITAIPEENSSFDAIMCIEVLEHVPDPIKVIKEFSRLIRPGGFLIITAPFCSLTHFSPFHFISGINSYWYEKFLPENKLEIIQLEHNGNFFEYIAQELIRTDSIAKRYSGKKTRLYEKFAMLILRNMLQRFSNSDAGSKELLCYDFHVLAKKII